MKQLLNELCYWWVLDGENCSNVVTFSPLGPMCLAHQREMWRVLGR